MEISYKGRIYNFKRPDGLSSKQFSERSWFITRMLPNNTKEYLRAETFADIFINKVYNGCIYSKELENNLNKIMSSDEYYNSYLKS